MARKQQNDDSDTPKGKRPAFQFYAGDWQRNARLRMCSMAARGFWHECLCIMHFATPYGHLTIDGTPMSDAEIARLVGDTPSNVKKYWAELWKHGVPSKTDTGVIYSRRMVRDEVIRLARANGGKNSLNNPNVPRPKSEGEDGVEGYPSPPSFGGSPSVSVSSSPSASVQERATGPTAEGNLDLKAPLTVLDGGKAA